MSCFQAGRPGSGRVLAPGRGAIQQLMETSAYAGGLAGCTPGIGCRPVSRTGEKRGQSIRMRTAHETLLSTWGDIPTLRLPRPGLYVLGRRLVRPLRPRALEAGGRDGTGGMRTRHRMRLCASRGQGAPADGKGELVAIVGVDQTRAEVSRRIGAVSESKRNQQGCTRSSTMEGLRRHAFEGCGTRVHLRFRAGGRARRRERERKKRKRSTLNQNVGMGKG